MEGSTQSSGWWLASDGNWYPPEQASGPVTTVATEVPVVSQGTQSAAANKGLQVLVGLVAVFVFGIGALGATYLLTSSSGSHWSSSARSEFVHGCSQKPTEGTGTVLSTSQCGCIADYMAGHGVSEDELRHSGPTLTAKQEKVGIDGLAKCT